MYFLQVQTSWDTELVNDYIHSVDAFTGYSQVFILFVLGSSLITLLLRGN